MKIVYIACKYLECKYIDEWEKNYKSIPYCRKINKELNETLNCYECKEFIKKK